MEQSCQDKIKIAIVGAGPSGVYCALWMSKLFKENNYKNYSISLFDKSQALRTILPTGNGRCNITNSISDIKDFCKNYPRGEKFLYSIFSRHFNLDSLDFFNSIGISTYIQEDGRIFPKSNSSKDVKDKLLNALKNDKNIKLVNKNITCVDDLSDFDKIVISCGSRGTEKLLSSFKHSFVPFRKALCALIIKDFKYPKGVSVKSLDGDFVFSENGISGPLAFKLSSINVDKKFPYQIKINLFDFEEFYNKAQESSKKTLGTVLSQFVPRSLAHSLTSEYDKKIAEVSKEKLKKLSFLELEILSCANKGEIVNSGGIRLNDVDKNCKSKIINNLWFCGEVLDIDGFCGGFNLQNCWSTAYVVANDIVCSIMK